MKLLTTARLVTKGRKVYLKVSLLKVWRGLEAKDGVPVDIDMA
ncbi:hypothetical protein [Metallosphaera tengchongensis]|nr:hypothetical protein [Metallosphaera tengchongensis]